MNNNCARKKFKYVPGRKTNIVIYLLMFVHVFRDLSEITFIIYNTTGEALIALLFVFDVLSYFVS